jgi:hypothetical protein
MDLLPLDDPRWAELDHRNWRHGSRSEWSPDAPFVPDELSLLTENPADIERFRKLWPWLCSEGTTYAAAYAAVPYMVTFAERLPPENRFEYLCVVGLVEAYSSPEKGGSFAIKEFLMAGYRDALSRALALIAETLCVKHAITETRYLLGAVAALKGHRKLAIVLQDMDAISGDCPQCGETIFPDELQEALR